MKIIRNYKDLHLKKAQAVTIGVFDGFHKGHQQIAAKTISVSEKYGLEPLAITFEPFMKSPLLLTTDTEKLNLLKDAGFKRVVILEKEGKWNNWTHTEFLNNFLKKVLNVKYIVVGKDFRFGKMRKGNIQYLNRESGKDLSVSVVELKKIGNHKISSSYIRKLIKDGDLALASKHLGRNYFIIGKKVSGDGFGREIGFPTINFNIDKSKLLPEGVFHAKAIFRNSDTESHGACFIGHTRTNKSKNYSFKTEIHMFSYEQWMDSTICGVKLIDKISDSERFSNISDLKNKIINDINKIKSNIK